jgi:hypothetical protein
MIFNKEIKNLSIELKEKYDEMIVKLDEIFDKL